MSSDRTDDAAVLSRLLEDGYLEERGGRLRTTRRFQLSMARAALSLARSGDDDADLRLPIAVALLERYGDSISAEELAECIDAMVPIEARELDPGRARDVTRTP